MDGSRHNHGFIPVRATQGTLFHFVLVNLQRWIVRWESGTSFVNIPSAPLAYLRTFVEKTAIIY